MHLDGVGWGKSLSVMCVEAKIKIPCRLSHLLAIFDYLFLFRRFISIAALAWRFSAARI